MLAMLEAGDCADRSLERNRRRYLRGIGFGIDAHEKGIFALVNVGELAVYDMMEEEGRPLLLCCCKRDSAVGAQR